MDATAVLVLTTKIGQIFQWKDSSLAHPIGFHSYDPEDFAAIPAPPSNNRQLRNLSEFSRLVNLQPSGPVWSPSASKPLWAVITDIYRSAIIAEDQTPSPTIDHPMFATAEDNSEGSQEDNQDKQKKYNQYEDRWNLLVQRLRVAEASTADNAEHATKLDALRVEISALEEEWKDYGFKDDPETSPLMFSAPYPTRFKQIWAKWKASLMEDVDFQTDSQGFRFVPTVYAPGDIVNSPSWVSIEMDSEEIQTLLDDPNPQLATVFGYSPGEATDIRKIRFQATSIDVIRSWLPEDLLSARLWRFPDPEKFLKWKGFVTGLILVRDIEIVTESNDVPDIPESQSMIEAGPIPELDDSDVEPERQPSPKFRRIAWIVSFLTCVLLTISIGGDPSVKTIFAVPLATVVMYGLFRGFYYAMRHRKFHTSRLVTGLAWVWFAFFSVTFIIGLLLLYSIFGDPSSFTNSGSCDVSDSAYNMGSCILYIIIGGSIMFGAILVVIIGSIIVLLIIWLLNRFQPLHRTGKYFRKNVEPAVFDRIDEDPDAKNKLESDRYPTNIFLAGFRIRNLGRVPSSDDSQHWKP